MIKIIVNTILYIWFEVIILQNFNQDKGLWSDGEDKDYDDDDGDDTMMTKTMMIMTPHNCGVISNAGAFVSLLNVDSPATGSVQSLVLGAENMILKKSFVF